MQIRAGAVSKEYSKQMVVRVRVRADVDAGSGEGSEKSESWDLVRFMSRRCVCEFVVNGGWSS